MCLSILHHTYHMFIEIPFLQRKPHSSVGKTLASWSRGTGFEPRRRHGVLSLGKALYPYFLVIWMRLKTEVPSVNAFTNILHPSLFPHIFRKTTGRWQVEWRNTYLHTHSAEDGIEPPMWCKKAVVYAKSMSARWLRYLVIIRLKVQSPAGISPELQLNKEKKIL